MRVYNRAQILDRETTLESVCVREAWVAGVLCVIEMKSFAIKLVAILIW